MFKKVLKLFDVNNDKFHVSPPIHLSDNENMHPVYLFIMIHNLDLTKPTFKEPQTCILGCGNLTKQFKAHIPSNHTLKLW